MARHAPSQMIGPAVARDVADGMVTPDRVAGQTSAWIDPREPVMSLLGRWRVQTIRSGSPATKAARVVPTKGPNSGVRPVASAMNAHAYQPTMNHSSADAVRFPMG